MNVNIPKIPMIDNDVIKKYGVEKKPIKTIGETIRMKLMKPISPCELENKRCYEVSPRMIETINELIKESWNGLSATVYVNEIGKRMNDPVVEKYLYPADVKNAYRLNGWNVTFNEFDMYFTFTKTI